MQHVLAAPGPHYRLLIRPIQPERPFDLDRLVQRISYRAVLGDRQLDRPKGVRPVDPVTVDDVPKVDVCQAGRDASGPLAFHLDVESYTDDVQRHRGLTTDRRVVIRCTAYEIRHEPIGLMRDLVELGVPRAA